MPIYLLGVRRHRKELASFGMLQFCFLGAISGFYGVGTLFHVKQNGIFSLSGWSCLPRLFHVKQQVMLVWPLEPSFCDRESKGRGGENHHRYQFSCRPGGQ